MLASQEDPMSLIREEIQRSKDRGVKIAGVGALLLLGGFKVGAWVGAIVSFAGLVIVAVGLRHALSRLGGMG